MLLLYILEFPLLVLTARTDVVYKLTGKENREASNILEIVEWIAKNKRLLIWCRNAIANQRALCLSVMSSAISLIYLFNKVKYLPGIISISKVEKLTKKCILRGEYCEKGFEELHNDLTCIISRDDIVANIVANSIFT